VARLLGLLHRLARRAAPAQAAAARTRRCQAARARLVVATDRARRLQRQRLAPPSADALPERITALVRQQADAEAAQARTDIARWCTGLPPPAGPVVPDAE
jgi:hypothetical protein